MERGILITIEGPEGSGKTSQIPHLVKAVRDQGYDVYPTREPGGTSIGEQIRDVLHDLKNAEMHPRTETLLYQAARAQNVEQVLLPMLTEGKIVILDRFTDSTIAYQGYGHRQDIEVVHELITYATGGLKPDLTMLLYVDAETGLKRKTNQEEWNRMDNQTLDFHKRVDQAFLLMLKSEPLRWRFVDARNSIETVRDDLIRITLKSLEEIQRGKEGNYIGKERF
jgi:dTMP kinase